MSRTLLQAIESLPAHIRSSLVEAGRQFNSEDTLEQANQTLTSLDTHGPNLAKYGFAEKDKIQLTNARNLLIEMGVGREDAKAAKKKLSNTQKSAIFQGKRSRETGRSVLEAVQEDFFFSSDPKEVEMIDEINTLLEQTSRADENPNKLAEQIQLITTLLKNPVLATSLKERKQENIAKELDTASKTLWDAAKEYNARPGTPEYTEKLDLIDGIILRLTRRAQRVALTASKDLGQDPIASAFKLTKLYPPTRKGNQEPPKS